MLQHTFSKKHDRSTVLTLERLLLRYSIITYLEPFNFVLATSCCFLEIMSSVLGPRPDSCLRQSWINGDLEFAIEKSLRNIYAFLSLEAILNEWPKAFGSHNATKLIEPAMPKLLM